MTIKTFTQAQLNASDLNTFASKGDAFIASAPITSNQILQCFSPAYENYRIVISDYYATAAGYLWMQLGFGTSWNGGNYHQAGAYVAMGSPFTITTFTNNNFLPYFRICAGDTSANHMNTAFINLSRPYTTNPTEYSCHTTLVFSSGLYEWNHAGKHNQNSSMDSIRWFADTGVVSAGTVSVYGMMQA